MDQNRPYEKRINLGIDTRNPDYKKAYDYICEHKGAKFRFICDCVLQVMEGRSILEQKEQEETYKEVQKMDLMSQLSANPELLQSLAQAVASVMPSAQPPVTEPSQPIEAVVAIPEKKVEVKENPVLSAYPNEEKIEVEEETGIYDGPILDADMLAGLGAWDEFLE